MDYRARIEQLCQELKAHPKITLKQAFLGPPVPEYELASYKHQAGGALPRGLEALWQQVSYVDIEWSCLNPTPFIGEHELTGSVHILPPSKTFQSWEDVLWFDFLERAHPYRSLHPFDFFIPEACTALYVQDPEGSHELYYHYCGEELHPTGLDVEQWFERMLMARGAWYWIEACCVEGQGSPQVEWLFEALPKLFKDFDPTLFSPKTTRGPLDV